MTYRAVYFDTETTGVKFNKDRVIEMAAYCATTNQSFSTLINPECPIPKEAQAIHHISDEMVKEAPTFEKVVHEFINFCSGDVALIAHNMDAFDKLFLEEEFRRVGVSVPESWLFVDTLKWARRYRPDLPKHSLQFLREVFEIEQNNAHRALDDVIILHKVFSEMIDDLPIHKVYELLNTKRRLQVMPFGKHQGKPLHQVPKDYVNWLKTSGAFDKPTNQELQESLEHLGLL
ncbi:MAG: DNA polymerase III PolC-type [Chlamydiae bacterium]|nr:DNA polymerase III PolC-type [Chlamydiota bacterium]